MWTQLFISFFILAGFSCAKFVASNIYITIPDVVFVEEPNTIILRTKNPATTFNLTTRLSRFNRTILKVTQHRIERKTEGWYGAEISYQSPVTPVFQSAIELNLEFLVNLCGQASCKGEFEVKNITTKTHVAYWPVVLLAESDKPIYRPGELVRLRFIALKPQFTRHVIDSISYPQKKLVVETYDKAELMNWTKADEHVRMNPRFQEIYVSDSNYEQIMQWLDVSPSSAIDLNFTLSDNVPEGEYTVTAKMVDGNMKQLHFRVENYIPQPFFINFVQPDGLTFDSKKTKFSVCAKHTNGFGLVGSVTAHLCVCSVSKRSGDYESIMLTNRCSKHPLLHIVRRPCLKCYGILDRHGCANFSVNTTRLDLKGLDYSQTSQFVILCATVKDEETESEITRCDRGSQIKHELTSLQLNIPAVYKIGLPLFGSVRLKHAQPAESQNALIKILLYAKTSECRVDSDLSPDEKVRYAYTVEVRTDETGLATFVIPPISSDETIVCEASYRPKDDPSKHRLKTWPPVWPPKPKPFSAPREVRVTSLLRPWQGTSSVNIQSWPIDSQVLGNCPGNVTVLIIANTQMNNRIIHVQTMVRGKFLHHRIDPVEHVQPCTDQNGSFGHYTCLDQNNVKCIDGWTGSDCLQPICAEHCDRRGGRCARPGECHCIPGWSGANCEKCRRRKGCIHGDCVHGDDCVCQDGWKGFYCENAKDDLDYMFYRPSIRAESELNMSALIRRTIHTRLIQFEVDGDWGPETNVVIFFEHGENGVGYEVVPTVVNIKGLENCRNRSDLLNTVNKQDDLKFDRGISAPGEKIGIYITPYGMTTLGNDELSSKDGQLNEQVCYVRIYDTITDEFEVPENVFSMKNIKRQIRSIDDFGKWATSEMNTVGRTFKKAGFLLTIWKDEKPTSPGISECRNRYEKQKQHVGLEVPLFLTQITEEDESLETRAQRFKNLFPQVWLFDVVPINELHVNNSNPEYEIHKLLKVPNSITSWRTSVVCTTKTNGLWSPQPKHLMVTMPFYVELKLPKTVRRGEILYLYVTVVITTEHDMREEGEAKSCYEVTVTTSVDHSDWSPVGPLDYAACLCHGEKRIFQLGLTSRKLGQFNVSSEVHAIRNSPMCGNSLTAVSNSIGPKLTDRQRRLIRIVPEGVPKERSIGGLICFVSGEKTAEQKFSFNYPDNLIEGSLRTHWSYTDEIFGRAIGNLDNLVNLPMGHLEKYILLVASNIHVLDYLMSVPRVNHVETKRLVRKARDNIVLGYNRLVEYRQKDGSYSAFVQSNEAGSIWLSLLVLRTFATAHKVNSELDVDWRNIFEGISNFLQSRQSASGSGCFEEKNNHSHWTIKQNGFSKQLLTSHVISVLRQLPGNYQNKMDDIYKHALRCVIPMDKLDKISTYELAQWAYTMRRTQPHGDTTVNLQKELIKRSRGSNVNALYWIAPHPPPTDAYDVKAVDIETTSYAYLSLVGDLLTRTDALSVIRWLTAQQNPNGGFKSTQDTVLALEAISDFAKHVGFNSSSADSVPIDVYARINPSGHQLVRKLTPETRRVLNTVELPPIHPINATEVTWKIKSTTPNSSSCLAVQTIQYYNVPKSKRGRSSPFRLMYYIEQRSMPTWDACIKPNLTVCLQMSVDPVNHYDSGMLLIRIHMVSGWKPSSKNPLKLMWNATESIRHLEFDEMGIVSVYFNGFTKKEAEASGGWKNVRRCVKLKLEQTNFVQNIQPAQIMAMDYYATGRFASIQYRVEDCREAWFFENKTEVSPVSQTRRKLTCPACILTKQSTMSLMDNLLNWTCTGYNNLFLFKVISREFQNLNVSVTKFGSSGYLSRWNAILDNTTCECSPLQFKTKLLFLAPQSLDIFAGQIVLSLESRQTEALLLDIDDADVKLSLNLAAIMWNLERNNTEKARGSDRLNCERISTLDNYLRIKLS